MKTVFSKLKKGKRSRDPENSSIALIWEHRVNIYQCLLPDSPEVCTGVNLWEAEWTLRWHVLREFRSHGETRLDKLLGVSKLQEFAIKISNHLHPHRLLYLHLYIYINICYKSIFFINMTLLCQETIAQEDRNHKQFYCLFQVHYQEII